MSQHDYALPSDGTEESCAAPGCERTTLNSPAIPFFSFPSNDPERFKIWKDTCLKAEFQDKGMAFVKQNCKLCGDHFDDTQFEGTFRENLLPHAIPSTPIFELEDFPVPSRKRSADVELIPDMDNSKQPRLVNDTDVVNGTNIALKQVLDGITQQLGLPPNTKIVYSTSGVTSANQGDIGKTRKIILIKRPDQTIGLASSSEMSEVRMVTQNPKIVRVSAVHHEPIPQLSVPSQADLDNMECNEQIMETIIPGPICDQAVEEVPMNEVMDLEPSQSEIVELFPPSKDIEIIDGSEVTMGSSSEITPITVTTATTAKSKNPPKQTAKNTKKKQAKNTAPKTYGSILLPVPSGGNTPGKANVQQISLTQSQVLSLLANQNSPNPQQVFLSPPLAANGGQTIIRFAPNPPASKLAANAGGNRAPIRLATPLRSPGAQPMIRFMPRPNSMPLLTGNQLQSLLSGQTIGQSNVKIAPAVPQTPPVRIVFKPPANSTAAATKKTTYSKTPAKTTPAKAAAKASPVVKSNPVVVHMPNLEGNQMHKMVKTKSTFTQTITATNSGPQHKALMLEKLVKEQKTNITALKRRINRLENRIIALKLSKKEKLSSLSLKTILDSARPYLSETTFDIFKLLFQKAEDRENGKSFKGIRYADCTKDFALCIYCCSKTAYRVCQSVFKLPSVKSIFRKKEPPKPVAVEYQENNDGPSSVITPTGEEIQIIEEAEEGQVMLEEESNEIIDLLHQSQQMDHGDHVEIQYEHDEMDDEQQHAITLIETVQGLEIMENDG